MIASVAQGRALLRLADRALDGLEDAHRAVEPVRAARPLDSGWSDISPSRATSARRLCGRAPLCPAEWRAAFPTPAPSRRRARATIPSCRLSAHPCARFTSICMTRPRCARRLLAIENPYAPARLISDRGSFVAYIVAGHFGYHLGQLVAWRAAAGFGQLPRESDLAG